MKKRYNRLFLHPAGQETGRRGDGLHRFRPRRRVPGGTGQQHTTLHIAVGHNGGNTEDQSLAALKQMQPLGGIFRGCVRAAPRQKVFHLGGNLPVHHIGLAAAGSRHHPGPVTYQHGTSQAFGKHLGVDG